MEDETAICFAMFHNYSSNCFRGKWHRQYFWTD